MLKIVTVCGNGIGSSLMLKMKIEEICADNNIQASVDSCDLNSAQGKNVDLIVTIKELSYEFEGKEVGIVRSYINKKKITEDILELIKKKAQEKNK
ncbi:MAG: PTS sugar transporter subunit IIB [Clostridium sp.]|uniref:PTS sugar transporter subunit IIB n=1 Tax=Clostridium sp. TaxID=1506 RepID=UPI003D6D23BD